MPISPCNTLNVKTIRISQLASVSSTDLTDDDVIYISQYDNPNNVYYSKRTTLSDLTNYIQGNLESLSGSFSGSFKGKSSGSFSGSHYGNLRGSSSYSLTSSYVNNLKQSLLPTTNNTFSLGSPSKKWKDLYVATSSIYLGDNVLSIKTVNNKARLHINDIKVLTNDDDVISVNESTKEAKFDTSLEVTKNLIIGGSQSNTISVEGQELQVDCSNIRNQTIYASASGVCILKIASGQTINVIVLQSAPLSNSNISFKALVYDTDGYYETKIIYPNGIVPKLSVGQSNSADLFTFTGVKSDAFSPNVNGTVVFANYTKGYLDHQTTFTDANIVNSYTTPIITVQPVSTTKDVSSNVTFSVTATGNPTPSYQWYKNGIVINGATSNTYTVSNITLQDAATYNVKVSNSAGFKLSNDAVLTVTGTSAPVIVTQPIGDETYENQGFSLYVSAYGTPAVSYQWKKNGVSIPGATSYIYSKTNATFDMAGDYSVVVTNTVGSVTSNTVTLTVLSNPGNVVVTQPIIPPPPTVTNSNGLISYRETEDYLNKMLSIVTALKTIKPGNQEPFTKEAPIVTTNESVNDFTFIGTSARVIFYYKGSVTDNNWDPALKSSDPTSVIVFPPGGTILETYNHVKKVSPKIAIYVGNAGFVRYFNSDWCVNSNNQPVFLIAKSWGSESTVVIDAAIFNNYLYILYLPWDSNAEISIKRAPLVTSTINVNNISENYHKDWTNLWQWSMPVKVFNYTTEELSTKNIFRVASTTKPGVIDSKLESSALGIPFQINATTLDVFNLSINGTVQPALVIKNKYLNKYFRSTDGTTWTQFTL